MRVLLTGGYGCIGAWITRNLLQRGDQVWIYDLKEDPRRLRLILDEERVRQVAFVPGDVTDLAGLRQAVEVGDIAADEADLAQLLLIQEQAEAVGVLLEVVDPGPVAAVEQVADDPAPDTPVTAGQEHTHEVPP